MLKGSDALLCLQFKHQYSFQSLLRIDAIEECGRGCQDIEALPTSHMTNPLSLVHTHQEKIHSS